MRFTFVDRVLEIQPGVKITTLKCLSLGEEYLADHFPRFPVMPGVLMLEAMTEASAWLIRATEDFAHSIVTLKEARNIRFADFVQPGRVLSVTAEILQLDSRDVQVKAQGILDGRTAVSGRFILERYNLADTRPQLAPTDNYLRRGLKARFALIHRPPIEVPATNGSAMIAQLGAAPEPSRGKVTDALTG
ncbi:MAG: beta-hydroxyacyl-ACP dehydratase [Planctomycetia bacterium]|nr:beta-hydroxyacyl-ACP dehydratase [Planctomycetia bacterium]